MIMAPITTKVISAAHRFREPLPVLVLLDMQKQHLDGSPQFVVRDAASVVAGCKKLLAAARTIEIPIAHTKRLEGDPFFNPESPLTDWVAECRPTPHEMLYEHTAPSIYSVPSFSRFFEHIQSPLIVLAGSGPATRRSPRRSTASRADTGSGSSATPAEAAGGRRSITSPSAISSANSPKSST